MRSEQSARRILRSTWAVITFFAHTYKSHQLVVGAEKSATSILATVESKELP